MQLINSNCQEEHVVLSFLQAERECYLTSPHLNLIDRPNVSSSLENYLRSEMLSVIRGYPDQMLFTNWPEEVAWQEIELSLEELGNLKIGNFNNWLIWTDGKRRVSDVATSITSTRIPIEEKERITNIANNFDINCFHNLILVGTSIESLVILDGNHRCVAAVIAKQKIHFKAFVGIHLNMKSWHWY